MVCTLIACKCVTRFTIAASIILEGNTILSNYTCLGSFAFFYNSPLKLHAYNKLYYYYVLAI